MAISLIEWWGWVGRGNKSAIVSKDNCFCEFCCKGEQGNDTVPGRGLEPSEYFSNMVVTLPS